MSLKVMYGADVLIFEGILAFHREDINELMDIKVSSAISHSVDPVLENLIHFLVFMIIIVRHEH